MWSTTMRPFTGENLSEYKMAVNREFDRLIDRDVPELDARAQAFAKISRERRDLLEAHLESLKVEKLGQARSARGVTVPGG